MFPLAFLFCEVVGYAYLKGKTKCAVCLGIQFAFLININTTRTLVIEKNCWQYSVAFDTATNHDDSYLNIFVGFFH